MRGRRLAGGTLAGPGIPPVADDFEASAARIRAIASAIRDGSATIEPITTPAVFIIDEPELHLHPIALEEIALWLRTRAGEGSHVLVATHSPSLLGHMKGASIGGLVEEPDGVRLREVSETGLAALEELATELGFGKGVWLQLTRGVLIVEGQHDLMVIGQFFGDELERAGIRLLALRGTKNTKRFIESDFLGQADIPLRVMFDNVRADALNERMDPKDFSGEEAELFQLLNQLSEGHDIRAVPFEAPDIICALPESAVTRAYPHASFPGWTVLEQEWRRSTKRENFKNFARRRIGIDSEVSSDTFVKDVLSRTRPDEAPGGGLKGAIAALLESL